MQTTKFPLLFQSLFTFVNYVNIFLRLYAIAKNEIEPEKRILKLFFIIKAIF